MTPGRLLLTVLAMAFVSPSAFADIIRFKNGTRMRGTIVKRTPTEVTVRLSFGTTTFAPSDIVAVEAEEPPISQPARRAETPSVRKKDAPAMSEPMPETRPPLSPPASGEPTPAEGFPMAEAAKAVALVVPVFPDGSVGVGSGAVVNRKGVLVTNFHVVADAERIEVFLPGGDSKISLEKAKSYEGTVLKSDPCYDLALVRVPISTPTYLHLAEDDELHIGEPVRAIGNPQGLTISVSKGVMSAIRSAKDLGADETIGQSPECAHLSGRSLADFTLIQTDASIDQGSSGGPLLNERGRIVGINSLMVVGMGGNMNFAIHVKHVRKFVGTYAKE